MARFSQEVKTPYGTKTYDEIRNTYNWIVASVFKLSNTDPEIEEEFLFNLGDVSCSTKSFSEFIEHAYGMNDFEIISFNVSVKLPSSERVYFNFLSFLSVSTEKKETLERILSLLSTTTLEDKAEAADSSVTYNNSVIVRGDNNTIANSQSSITVGDTRKNSGLKNWLIAIGQNILANGIWYSLCLAAGAIIAMIATK